MKAFGKEKPKWQCNIFARGEKVERDGGNLQVRAL